MPTATNRVLGCVFSGCVAFSVVLICACNQERPEKNMATLPPLAAEIEALKKAYAAFNRNDIAATVEAMDSQIEWTEPARSDIDLSTEEAALSFSPACFTPIGSIWEESKDAASCKYIWSNGHKKTFVRPVQLPFRESLKGRQGLRLSPRDQKLSFIEASASAATNARPSASSRRSGERR